MRGPGRRGLRRGTLKIILATADDKMVMFDRATATIVLKWPIIRRAGTTRTPDREEGREKQGSQLVLRGLQGSVVDKVLVRSCCLAG